MECPKSDAISNLWDATKSSAELFRDNLFNFLKCCTVIFDKNWHNSIEAPLEIPLREVKDNVTVWFFMENQGNEHQVSQATASSKSAFEILMRRKTVCLSKKPAITKKEELYNDLLMLKKDLKFPQELSENASKLFKYLTDALWEIDGNHN